MIYNNQANIFQTILFQIELLIQGDFNRQIQVCLVCKILNLPLEGRKDFTHILLSLRQGIPKFQQSIHQGFQGTLFPSMDQG